MPALLLHPRDLELDQHSAWSFPSRILLAACGIDWIILSTIHTDGRWVAIHVTRQAWYQSSLWSWLLAPSESQKD